MVRTAPSASDRAMAALLFCKALHSSGHEITRVFFYGDGALSGNTATVAPQDEPDIPQLWQEFLVHTKIDAVVCISAALRRGILDPREQERYDKSAAVLAPPFALSGLGQLVEAIVGSDRFITFA